MDVIQQLFVVFVAAAAAGELFARLRQPPIVGELLAGALLGPHALGWIHVNPTTETLAAVGIVVLLFTVGLELRVSDLIAAGRGAALTSGLGVGISIASVAAVVVAFGYGTGPAVRVGLALAATSAGIGARLLADLRLLDRPFARVALGAAVLDDVIVLVVFSLVLRRAASRPAGSVALGIAAAVGFVVLVGSLGPWLARRHRPRTGAPADARLGRSPLVFALALCLGLAALAERAGLAALIGAFLAGMTLAETRQQYGFERAMKPIYEFVVPFFFVIAGARLDPGALGEAGVPLLIVLVLVVVASKAAAGLVGAVGLDRRERLLVGATMVPRGEVTLATASAALAAGLIPVELFSAVIVAVFVSALVPSFVMGWSVGKREARP